jgi:hypothetical protein
MTLLAEIECNNNLCGMKLIASHSVTKRHETATTIDCCHYSLCGRSVRMEIYFRAWRSAINLISFTNVELSL